MDHRSIQAKITLAPLLVGDLLAVEVASLAGVDHLVSVVDVVDVPFVQGDRCRTARASRVEVHFPKFGDGRGYSVGRLLRERYGYRGELRAVGQVGRDHLYDLEQCGFDAFELKDGEDAQEALAAFEDFSEAYQATAAPR